MADSCVYNGKFDWLVFVIVIYVDDTILIGNYGDPRMEMIKEAFKRTSQMEDLGPVNQVLGWIIKRNRKEKKIKIT